MEADTRGRQFMIWCVMAAILGVLFLCSGPVETIPYSQFEALLDKVAEVSVVADSIQGTLRQPLPSGKRESFAVRADPQLAEKLAARYGDRP